MCQSMSKFQTPSLTRLLKWLLICGWVWGARSNPLLDKRYDGVSQNPFEAMFVKVKAGCLTGAIACRDAAEAAVAYDRFLTQQVCSVRPGRDVGTRFEPNRACRRVEHPRLRLTAL